MEKYCRSCNTANPAGAVFCRSCAASEFYFPPQQQQHQQPPPVYGAQAAYPPVTGFAPQGGQGASTRAISAMVLAICALLCCGFFTGIPAAILGWMEIAAIKEGRSSPKGMVMAQVGLWGGIALSIISLLLSGLYLLMVVLSSARGF